MPSVRKEIAIQPEVIETLDFVLIKIRIPEGISENDFKVRLNANNAVIKWDAGYLEHIIRLPAGCLKDRAAAVLRKGILEVKIPRQQAEEVKQISIHNF